MQFFTCKECGNSQAHPIPSVELSDAYKSQALFVRQLVAIVEAKKEDEYVKMIDLIEEANFFIEEHDNADKACSAAVR